MKTAQAVATIIAMMFNFQLNNEITYAISGCVASMAGLLVFMLVCGVGAVANVGIAKAL